MESLTVAWPTAFLAGVVSFLSPCVLPLVPSTVAFVSGLSLDDLTAANGPGAAAARRTAAWHATLFGVGFTIVFMTLGAAATQVGTLVAQSLPWINRIGGALIVVFGLYLAGVLKLPRLNREARVHLARRPAGALGTVAVGVVFGAGWSPCIGPVLASILLLASLGESALRGSALLGVYAIGLWIPFMLSAVGMSWFLTSSATMRRWSRPAQRLAGTFLVLVGLLLLTGTFTRLSATLAGMGQLINLEP